MKIAVMSDSHDHLENVDRVVALAGEQGAEILLHCGDICSPFVMDRLAPFKGQVHVVFGNNDGDHLTIGRIAERFSNITIHHHTGIIETDKGLVAFTHYPEHGKGLAATGNYAAVFSGHTHVRMSEIMNDTPHINPGETMGLLGDTGFVIFDLESGESEEITI